MRTGGHCDLEPRCTSRVLPRRRGFEWKFVKALIIVRRSANIDLVLKRTLNSDGNGFESLKEWKVTGERTIL